MFVSTDTVEHIAIAAGSVITTGTVVKVAAYVSRALPPLPPNSGWWKQLFYSLVKGASNVDPNSTTLSQEAMKSLPPSVTTKVAEAVANDK